MTPCLSKRCFLTWVKKWVLLTVFLKSCVLPKTLFLLCFQQNTAFQKQKLYVEQKQKIDEKLWVVFEHGKMVFFGFVFLRF